jgi:TIR domain
VLPPLGDIPLLLVDPERAIDYAPSGIPVGLVTLHAWRVSPLPRVPDDLQGYSAYLIEIAYDLDTEPDAPRPNWFELGFTFAAAQTTVYDALPRRTGPDRERMYALNGQLAFVRQDQPAADLVVPDIRLPEITSKVVAFGCRGPQVRWRHTSAARTVAQPGPFTGWIVLLAPQDQRDVRVFATARFSVPTGQAGGQREADRPDAFTVALPRRQTATAHRAAVRGPRVFVSYAHDSAPHKADVIALSRLLESADVNVTVDQNEPPTRRQDWNRWMTIGITRSDFVIVVASPAYRSVGLFEFDNRTHAGAQAEYRLISNLLAESQDVWLPRILPVILPGGAIKEIPAGLHPYLTDRYVVPSLTPDGVAELVQVIKHGRPGAGS